MRSDIDRILVEKGADALLLISESFKDVNMYYLARFLAPDPFIFMKKVGSPPTVVVNSMEFPRARKQSIARNVYSYDDYDYLKTVKSAKEPQLGEMKFYSSVVKKEIGEKAVIAVPKSFSSLFTDFLRSEGLDVKPFPNLVESARETKEPDELNEIAAVQKVAEKAASKVINTISNSDVHSNGDLIHKKQPLTSGKLRSLIGHVFIDEEIIAEDTIVAGGPKSAMPHYSGKPADVLKANQPIILDIFPYSVRRRYGSDMTRTVVKGKAPREIKKMFDAVFETLNASLDALHAGVLGSDMFDVSCNVLERAGYQTIRGGKRIEKGFIHSLGHGVGLEVHEAPRMSEVYRFPLKEQTVVTVEPGLYDPRIGGVRIENIVEVTKQGHKDFTKMPIQLEI